MDVISPINNALALVTRLRQIDKNISEAEFKNFLADLSMELGDAKMQIAELKEQNAKLMEENQALKASKAEPEKHSVKWGCYQFEGDPELYCTACYDTKRQKSNTTRVNSKIRHCPVCKSTMFA